MVNMASGIARGRVGRHDGDDDGGVTQDGSHTPNNRLTETCSLGLLCTFLIYDML